MPWSVTHAVRQSSSWPALAPHATKSRNYCARFIPTPRPICGIASSPRLLDELSHQIFVFHSWCGLDTARRVDAVRPDLRDRGPHVFWTQTSSQQHRARCDQLANQRPIEHMTGTAQLIAHLGVNEQKLPSKRARQLHVSGSTDAHGFERRCTDSQVALQIGRRLITVQLNPIDTCAPHHV